MNVFEALFPRLWKKDTGTFFDTKRISMANFSGFNLKLEEWSNLKNHKIGTYASLPWNPSIRVGHRHIYQKEILN